MKNAALVFALVLFCLFPAALVSAHPLEEHADEAAYAAEHLEDVEALQAAEQKNTTESVPKAAFFSIAQISQKTAAFFSFLEPLNLFFSKVAEAFRELFTFSRAPASSANQYPEIRDMLALSNASEQAQVYRRLIERVGAVEAQEALFRSGLPPTGETHLVQHEVGRYLYETEGKDGISKCTLYFLAACYHEFIILLLSYEGLDVLPDVMEECWKFGPSVASQCAHGIGHGLLVWHDYKNLGRAAAGCDLVAEESNNFPTLNCLDGVFMENQWALHPGATSEDQWLSETDPYYPCSDPRLAYEWLAGCWLNQGSVMYQFFGENIGKTAEACGRVEDVYHKKLCYNSLSRQIHPLTKSEYGAAVRMCGEVGAEWREYCLKTIAVSDFSVGGRDLSYRICKNLTGAPQDECYQELIGIIEVYAMDDTELAAFCAPITEKVYRSQCVSSAQF